MTRQLEGFDELNKKLGELTRLERGRALRSAGTAAGNRVIKEAKGRAPVGKVPHKTYTGRWVSPGFLSRSLHKKVRLSRDRRFLNVRIGVRSEAYYGLNFVELGTSRQSKQPWLRPAFRSTQREQVDIFRDRLGKAITRIARRRK